MLVSQYLQVPYLPSQWQRRAHTGTGTDTGTGTGTGRQRKGTTPLATDTESQSSSGGISPETHEPAHGGCKRPTDSKVGAWMWMDQ